MNTSQLMRRVVLLFILVLCFANISAAQNTTYNKVTRNGQTYYIYKVKTGEGLYAVSRTFGVPVADLIKINPGTENGLKNGQELLVPALNEIKEIIEVKQNRVLQDGSQLNVFQHTVTRGTTLFSISQMYNTTVAEIKRVNPGLTDDINEGQVINIPQQKISTPTSEENYLFHTIQPKETLHSVSRQYSLKPEDLMNANSGLSVETFQIGKIIRIPTHVSNFSTQQSDVKLNNEIYKVKKGENLFSISQKYGLKVSDLQAANPQITGTDVKANSEIIIPLKGKVDENQLMSEIDADRLLSNIAPEIKANVIRVGLLLPFLDKTDNQHYRLQEYYEGFAMAVEKMKRAGANIELYVFEIGTKAKLESLLGTMEMQHLHLIIGGMTDEQIGIISKFSQKNNIKYVVPFSSRNNEVLNNDKIFQVNTPHLYLYAKASSVFTEQFRDKNVILVNVPQKTDKADFVTILKSDLKRNNISNSSVTLNDDFSSNLLPLLSKEKENIIVPTSGDSGALKDIMHTLSEVYQEDTEIVTRLFGYPEWQTFASDIKKLMHFFGTYFYSSFYVDNNNPATRQFTQDFKKWYGRDLINTFPQYGMFGYDTGLYFLNAIYRNGLNFEKDVEQISSSDALQFAFNFDRVNNWGGFINSGLFLIHFDSEGRVQKINKSR